MNWKTKIDWVRTEELQGSLCSCVRNERALQHGKEKVPSLQAQSDVLMASWPFARIVGAYVARIAQEEHR